MRDNEHETPIVGIDLGTTYSLVAVLERDRAVLIPNALGELLTPSAVSVDMKGELLVGAAAKARVLTHPERTATMFKRDMGTSKEIVLEGHAPFRPEQLSALVLLSLKQDAEAYLRQPVARAVITVPAYFGDLQRQATRDAARIAGLEVDRIINEPTAAALAYGLANKDAAQKVVVLDLGGGTFDVTVLEIDNGVIEIRSSAGDARLGGEDYTDAIAAFLQKHIAAEYGALPKRGQISQSRIREHAEQLKKSLTQHERAAVELADLELESGRANISFAITRAEVLSVVAELNQRLQKPIQRALRDANMLPSAIDEVLLVGGATRMPWVQALAQEFFSRAPRNALPPDEAVAWGAAIQAGLHANAKAVEDIVVTDVAPFSLGVETSTMRNRILVSGLFEPVLERGTVIPTSRQRHFFTSSDNQTIVLVKVYQGEHSLTANNTLLGQLRVSGIPPAKAGMSGIVVRFTYNLDGILDVDVEVVGTGKTHQLVIERNPGQLSHAEVDAARAAMAKLKFHPRESLPNRTALARAEALYVSLRGAQREELGYAIRTLLAELETQDPDAIAQARFALLRSLELFEAYPSNPGA